MQYREEDADARLENLKRFRSLVLSQARALIPDESEWGVNDKDDVDDHLDDWEMKEIMAERGIAARSDLLQQGILVDGLAGRIAGRCLAGNWEEWIMNGSGRI